MTAKLTLTGPCIDVCKYTRPGPDGLHCIGCAMTEAQKAGFKALDTDAARLAELRAIAANQTRLGGYSHWPAPYVAKCARKGMALPDLGPDISFDGVSGDEIEPAANDPKLGGQ